MPDVMTIEGIAAQLYARWHYQYGADENTWRKLQHEIPPGTRKGVLRCAEWVKQQIDAAKSKNDRNAALDAEFSAARIALRDERKMTETKLTRAATI